MDDNNQDWHQSEIQDRYNQAYTNSRKRSYGLLQALINAWGNPQAEETEEEKLKRLQEEQGLGG